jgi:hypothetical protein
MKVENKPSSMTEGRALLTEREREALADDESGSYRYKTRTYLRNRLDRLERDAELLREHEPELYERLQATVCDDAGATGADTGTDTQARETPASADEPQAHEPGHTPADVLGAVDTAAGNDDTGGIPATVDHDDAAAAVAAARDYIRDHDGATKQDLVKNVMPDHPLGYDADAALGKIDTDGERFRGAWWRRVVKPGLKALDDVETPPRGASTWRHTGGEE